MAKNKSNNKPNNNRVNQAPKVTAAKMVGSEKKAEPVTPVKQKLESSKPVSNTTGIVISAIVVLLLIAGIGFLVVGLAQSLNKNQSGSVLSDQTAANNTAAPDASPSASPATADSSDGSSTTGSNSSSTEGQQVIAQANRATTRYKATNSVYKRGNYYKFGDITGSSYVTRKGDTLWQIAQARYNSGYAWVDINKANGGFKNLKNGKPVNIPVGYRLILPELD